MSNITQSPGNAQLTIRPGHRPDTLLDCVRQLRASNPDRTAITLIHPDAVHTLTYRALFEGAARYASALQRAGVGPGDLVVLVLQHGHDVLFSFWGAMLLGAIPSIMPFLTPKLDPERYFASVRQLVTLSEVKAVITYPELFPALQEQLGSIPTLGALLTVDDLDASGTLTDFLDRAPAQPDDTALLQHSSGSTGLQKGVMLTNRAVLNQIAAYSTAIQLTPQDVIASWLPLYHDMGLIAGFIMPIVQGIHLVLLSPFHWVRDPQVLLRAIQDYRATLCWLPNFAYNFLATRIRKSALDDLDLSSLRSVINCSEPVRHDSHATFADRFGAYGLAPGALQTCYAMAENTFAVTQSPLGQPPTLDLIDRATLMELRLARPAEAPNGTITRL